MNNILLTQITADELKELIAQALQGELEKFHLQNESSDPETLLTRKQAANALGISLPTLNDYTKRGLVPAYRIGTRVRYKQGEILDCLKKIQAKKYHA